MESWSYVSEGKGFVSDESISALDSFENQGFMELGFPETMRKFYSLNNPVKETSSISRVVSERTCTPIPSTTYVFSGDNDSTSKFSSSVVESNSRGSSLIDLKLGGHNQNLKSSAASFTPAAKRVRACLSSQTPFCQVYGCKKDLSSSKDYHKRHKVCEVHSKTAKVIVNGVEQRFCQQCSRFHLIAEFDDGKRSCRKRLAGHNERRRKPQVGILSSRSTRVFQPYIDSAGSMLTTSSFICQDILPSNLLYPLKYGTNEWSKHIKQEGGNSYSPHGSNPVTNGHLHPKSLFPHCIGRNFPPFHANGVNLASGGEFNKNSNQNPHDPGPSNSISGSLIQNTSIASEDLILFDSASTIQGLSGISTDGHALSLLSSQSQNSSSHSSEIPMAQPLIVSGYHSNYGVTQDPEKLFGVGLNASSSEVPHKFNSTRTNLVEVSHFGPTPTPDHNSAVNFVDGIIQASVYMNGKNRLSCDDGPTIDLLQLSSQLQRVEHQKQSLQVRQENNPLRGHKIT